MCGISGIYQPNGTFDPKETDRRLRAADVLIAHRGPDAAGFVLRPEEGVGFGHRRLAILDLDPRANQPMASADGNILITFNGEIYNFREIREELRREGSAFKTESDTEVLIEGYRRWGMDRLLPKLCGMFAFALYDADRKRLLIARDRAGKKPLLYSDNGPLSFCSELRGLFKLLDHRPEIDPIGLDAYLSLKFTPPPRTLLKGIHKIPPGFYLQKDGAQPGRLQRYWHPYGRAVDLPNSAEECLERLDAALSTAVRRRLVSDVPVCLFLSGGIDSSLVAAYLAKGGVKDMTAYSIGYGDLPEYNEFKYSRMAAERFPVRYQEITLESRQALETLEDDGAALDEPISDWIWVPLYHLSRRAHQDGFKVALVGEGSDELFFGYDVMLRGLHDIRRFENPLWKSLAHVGSSVLAPIYRSARKGHRRYDLMRRVASGEPVYMGSSIGFGRSQRHQVAGPRLLSSGNDEAGVDFVRSLYNRYQETASHPRDAVNLICYVEFYSKMSEVLLQRVDRVSMLHSLEARCPFLDHELAELAFAIPGDWKIPEDRLKGLLKRLAVRYLPEPIVHRRKMGFSFPFKEWLRGDLGPVVEKTFDEARLIQDGWLNGSFCQSLLREHRQGWFDHAPRLWMLFDLCRWYDRWVA